MISIKILFFILFIHWVADFIIQTDAQAKGKSKNWKDLLSHTVSYSTIWLVLSCFFFDGHTTVEVLKLASLFAAITFACHTTTDYFTSRLNAKLWREQKSHLFFVSVGFDQILHYVQLILTYYYLTN